jgi:hypothetical protein
VSAHARRRIPGLILLGTLLLQGAWILAVPPFGGADEIDHAYRAGSVALGYFDPTLDAAENGRGDLLVVPKSIVTAARPICEWHHHVGPDNCRPVEQLGDDRVLVASAAARYHPGFYWIAGSAASPFDGTYALYTMRLVTAFLCAAFVALAAWTTTLWARTPWPYASLLVALTPVCVYSTSVAAPNGIEMSAGLALWTALLGLTREDLSEGTTSRLLTAAAPALLVLTSVRQLGPLFAVLVSLVALFVLGGARIRRLVSEHRRGVTTLILVGAIGCGTNVWWLTHAEPLGVEHMLPTPDSPLAGTLEMLPVWGIQIIAMFPTKYDLAPATVYVIWLTVFAALSLTAVKSARRRVRLGLLLTAIISIIVPVGLTLPTIADGGAIWQGRYGLPFAMGLPVLAGLALDTKGMNRRLTIAVLLIGGLLISIAHVLSLQRVYINQNATSPMTGSDTWISSGLGPLSALAAGGVLIAVTGALAYRHTGEKQGCEVYDVDHDQAPEPEESRA